MQDRAFKLTARRVAEESTSGKTPGATTSILSWWCQPRTDIEGAQVRADGGLNGVGWEGEEDGELYDTRMWLNSRAVTIYGGTNEVQMNIIAKRVLGLPD